MNDDRWVVLGLARPRSAWFTQLSRWSTSAAVPVEFVKCVSADEVRARLRGGRAYSAVFVGARVLGLDRDLVESCREVGATVIVVAEDGDRDCSELGIAAVIPGAFDRPTLMSALRQHAPPIDSVAPTTLPDPASPPPSWRGQLIAVTGPPGAGASVLAMAIAQAAGREPGRRGSVALADLALDADLGMLHDAREVTPGVQELVEAHRAGRISTHEIRALLFDGPGRGYHLLLGLRRHRDWTAIRPTAFGAALDGLLRAYRTVVADTDADIENEAATGSLDIEDRNTMARTTLTRADIVVVVGDPTTKGVHAVGRTTRNLLEAEIDPARTVMVCNRAPRTPRTRAVITRALAAVLESDPRALEIANPVFVPDRGDVEATLRDANRLPEPLGRPAWREISRRLAALEPAPGPVDHTHTMVPIPVEPGTLGHWAEEAG